MSLHHCVTPFICDECTRVVPLSFYPYLKIVKHIYIVNPSSRLKNPIRVISWLYAPYDIVGLVFRVRLACLWNIFSMTMLFLMDYIPCIESLSRSSNNHFPEKLKIWNCKESRAGLACLYKKFRSFLHVTTGLSVTPLVSGKDHRHLWIESAHHSFEMYKNPKGPMFFSELLIWVKVLNKYKHYHKKITVSMG